MWLAGSLPGVLSLHLAAAGRTAFMLFHICVQHAVGEGRSRASARRTSAGWRSAFPSRISGPFSPLRLDTFGYRVAFLLLSGFAFTSFLVLAVRRKHSRTTPTRAARGAAQRLRVLRNPSWRRVFPDGMLASAWDLVFASTPITARRSAQRVHHRPHLGSCALATILVRVALPWISQLMRDWTMITATMCIACVAYALLPMVRTVPLLASIAFLLGIGLGATQPSVMNLIYAEAPAGRAGEAVGVRTVVLM